MATYAGKLTVGGTTIPIGSTLYGTCTTAAETAAKVVALANFDTLLTGVTIHVKMSNSNTAANPTLNVNSTGAKAIMRYGTTRPGTNANASWNAGAIVSFTYDGTNWVMNDWLNATYTIPAAATAAPLIDGTAAVGSSAKYAREDHVHPYIMSRSHANNSWTLKFSNGIMICTLYKKETIAITTAAGSWYTNSTRLAIGNWSEPFLNTPYTVASNSWLTQTTLGSLIDTSATSAGTANFFRPSSAASIEVAVYVIGIGHWKEE